MLLGSLCYWVCQAHFPKAISSSFPKMTVLLSLCFKNMEFRYYCFPYSSVGKESTCNVEDPSSIPGLGRSAGEGISYLLQCSWASLGLSWLRICLQCGRLGFNPWVRKISWRREKSTHSSILAWRIPWTVEPGSQRTGHD